MKLYRAKEKDGLTPKPGIYVVPDGTDFVVSIWQHNRNSNRARFTNEAAASAYADLLHERHPKLTVIRMA